MQSINEAIEALTVRLEADPQAGAGPDTAVTARMEDGLRCRVSGKHGELVTDMSKALGGGQSAPSPGYLMRAALAACDATVIASEAAQAGIELTHLSVTVDSDSDARGMLGLGDGVPPGPLRMRIRVELAADGASEEELRELVRRSEQRSPVNDAVARAIPTTMEVVVAP